MARSSTQIPVTGKGALCCGRAVDPVDYSIRTKDNLKSGVGSAVGSAEHMALAFSTGAADLKLETGSSVRVMFVGYTQGSDTAYFEITRN